MEDTTVTSDHLRPRQQGIAYRMNGRSIEEGLRQLVTLRPAQVNGWGLRVDMRMRCRAGR